MSSLVFEVVLFNTARPKHGVDTKFTHFVNEYDEVMTKHFTKRFIHHRGIGLAAQRVSELALHHAKRGFDIGPLVIVLQELLALEHEEVVHLAPLSAAIPLVMSSERNVRRRANAGNCSRIVATRISLIRRNLGDVEILRSRVDHRRKQLRVVSVPVANLYSCNDVGLDSAHEMALNPILLRNDLAVLVVVPASKPRRSKAGRIHSEIHFNRPPGR